MTKQLKGMFLLALPLMLASCGSFQGVSYYGDGIYGEELPVEVEQREVITYEQQRTSPTHYKSYFNEMAEKANGVVTDYTSFTDVDSYQSATNRPSYAGWGQNTSRDNVTINVYDNYYNRWGYDPYYDWNYGSNYYWGMGAWSPYYRSSWGYYGPRSRVRFGFGWSSGWNYPYYGYDPYYYGYGYYGYRPYYYGYAYDPYYYGGGYYPYYGNTVYRNSNNYARVRGRRGENMDYSSLNGTRGRSEYNNRSYSRRNNNTSSNNSYNRSSRGTYTPSSNNSNTYSRQITPTSGRRAYETTPSSTSSRRSSYERSSNSSSSESYGRSSNSSSGRSYSRGRRGG